jgi:hypothetical protein
MVGGNSWDWKKWLRNEEMPKKGGNGWDRGNEYITLICKLQNVNEDDTEF